ncbi:MAG: hypothetical protein H0U10_04830, partial [Chloroflexia bacterium]|nr:hypothetical protein [Chloroflexia bacterium]
MHVYGAPATTEPDAQVKHGGKRSLRISADQPSDAAVGQEVTLRPRQWYRFTGWVRTRGLEPRDATVFGTFQIQRSGGQAVLAGGPNHKGDTDWTKVSIFFQAPPDGRARISVFFAGYGKGAGTAWFDDLALEAIDVAGVPVRVTREPLADAEINPYQYGQFIEYLADVVPAMWAGKLDDESFEGLSPYKFAYLKETDFREKPWYPSGAVNRAVYALTPTDPVSGNVAQEINAGGDTPCDVGISQDGISVRADRADVFSCYLRREGVSRPVEVRLHREGKVYASATFQPTAEWKKYTARLVASGTDHNATLSIRFEGPGRLWLDSASLMPEDAVGGWRPDVVEATRALEPGIIRFGGTALEVPDYGDFEWRDTIGDPDRRKPFRAWGGLQPTGPGLEEIVQFCHHVGAEPLICVRVTGRTPQDAAEQVQYFNGAADTPMGKLRAANG